MKTIRMNLTPYILLLLLLPVLGCSDDDDGPASQQLDMALVPAGSFTMGDQVGDGFAEEKPTRSVTLSGFYMSNHEVTQKLYQEIMGENPSHNKGDSRPAENMTWFKALEFCNALSAKHGYTPCYSDIAGTPAVDMNANGYRLPTEAEWEYACRAGTATNYHTGNGEANLARAGWYSGNTNGSTQDVGKKEANSFGLFDTHGNVFEWCWDWYKSDYYKDGGTSNPTGPSGGSERVCRGGSYFVFEYGCRSSFRSYLKPSIPSRDIGIRLVRKAS
ncbi:MAG: SUMF1/EgtB/PvdO family nonheme iron enzyme [Bacteroidetes bacterium]|nr:SUMF1/EgtB/PvdO family nonheme iron enzyme [Bacteroidota bacterium]